MQPSFANDKNRLTTLQLELLKGLKYMATEKQIADVKSLLRFYFAQQLDASIEKVENERNYTSDIYEQWLSQSRSRSSKAD